MASSVDYNEYPSIAAHEPFLPFDVKRISGDYDMDTPIAPCCGMYWTCADRGLRMQRLQPKVQGTSDHENYLAYDTPPIRVDTTATCRKRTGTAAIHQPRVGTTATCRKQTGTAAIHQPRVGYGLGIVTRQQQEGDGPGVREGDWRSFVQGCAGYIAI